MLYENLRQIASRAPATSGLRHAGSFQPYAALAERVERLAAGFLNRGIGSGDPVVVLLPNGPDIFVAIHALFAIGAIAMPLSVSATPAEITVASRKAGAKAMIVAPDRESAALEIAADLGGIPVFVAGGEGDNAISTVERATPTRLTAPSGTAPALYLLSSGSTGLPKIVPHTHAELLSDARRTSTAWQLTPDDVVFDMLPSNFAMGLLLGLIDAAEAGATTVYWSDPRPLVLARRALVDALASEKVTLMGAVPAMHDAIAGTPGDDRLPHLRLAFSGGAALRRTTFEAFRGRFGIALRQAYGSTEAIMVSHNDSEDPDTTWNSVGRPAGDAEVRLAPMETAFGPDVGELMIRSSSMTAGYLGEPAQNSQAFPGGWLMSGDLGRLDGEGRIYIVGRSKLLIEVSGYKIDPIEVEETLRLHPAVADAAVVGARPASGGELRLKAVVVRRDDVSPDQLTRFVRERLSAQKVPTLIEFRDDLPRSDAGKVLRGRLGEDA